MVERYISAAETFLAVSADFVSSYKDKKALKEHGESADFQKFQKGVAEQGLLLEPPTIHVMSPRGGFSRL
jgi:quinol monooxygenase YgiN